MEEARQLRAPLELLGGSSSRKVIEMAEDGNGQLLTPAEVAEVFRVDPKTVTRWAKAGKLSSLRTLGGHRRYRADEIRILLGANEQQSSIIDVRGQQSSGAVPRT
ncbi:MAG: hypothetical protein QOH48_1827 [Actinomycetota bacterium]|nr:hypothetical protein [Actinomycetota bacterium]